MGAVRPSPGTGGSMSDTSGSAVEFVGLTTIDDDEPVLLDLRLRLQPGSLTVLLGASEAGRSLLVRHLVGLTPPGAGTVRIDGTDLWAAGPDARVALRRRTGVMLGGSTVFDASLFGSLTAADNIRAGLAERGIGEEVRDQRCGQLLHDLRLQQWTEWSCTSLSRR
jgi:ABC-type transporter Mla maintaining outer membrane lipid asymmetry ATPase subunit MlaF